MPKQSYLFASIFIFGLIVFSSYSPFRNNVLPWKNGILNGAVEVMANREGIVAKNNLIKGNYRNNQKTGRWQIFNSKGELLATRDYQNNYTFSTVDGAQAKKISRNKDGYYSFGELKEENILFAKRMKLLIDENLLKSVPDLLIDLGNIDFKKITAYKTDQLRELKKDHKLPNMSFVNSIKLMGDWFYDREHKVLAYAIIAISFVERDAKKSVWYYFPELRKQLANIPFESDMENIRTLDDYFFFTAFPYHIYCVEKGAEGCAEVPNRDNLLQELTYSSIEELLMWESNLWTVDK